MLENACAGAILLAAGAALAAAQAGGPANQERFLGKWKLEISRSKAIHADELQSGEWRSYEQDGDRVKVSFGDAGGRLGSYSAKCDGSLETGASGKLRCWQKDLNTMEGEQLDPNDSTHRYYRRVLSRDGKTLSILWFRDALRSKLFERLVYTRD